MKNSILNAAFGSLLLVFPCLPACIDDAEPHEDAGAGEISFDGEAAAIEAGGSDLDSSNSPDHPDAELEVDADDEATDHDAAAVDASEPTSDGNNPGPNDAEMMESGQQLDGGLGDGDGGGGGGDTGSIDSGLDGGASDGAVDGATVDAEAGAVPLDPKPCGSAVGSGPVLLDLGHGSRVESMMATTTRLVSLDSTGRWMLWNLATRDRLATGDVAAGSLTLTLGAVALKGDTLMVASDPDSIEIWNAVTGVRRMTISGARKYQLAADGSYVVGYSGTSLTIWDAVQGTPLVDRSGNYANAMVYAAPGEARVALGPAGATTIESITTSGSGATSTFSNGTFVSWFLDGENFFTRTGTTVWVYPKGAGSHRGIFALSTVENLAGMGDRFWTYAARTVGYPLNVYSVPGTSSPIASFSGEVLTTLGTAPNKLVLLAYGDPRALVIDLSTSTPTPTTVALPAPYPSVFAGTTSGTWFVGNTQGLVHDVSVPAAPRSFGCGAAWSMSSADDGSLAIGTASGIILAKLTSIGLSVQGRMPIVADQVALSATGTVMVVKHTTKYSQYDPNRTLTAFSMPSGDVSHEWLMEYPSSGGGVNLFDFDLARGGTHVGFASGTFSGSAWTLSASLAQLGGATTTVAAPTSPQQLISIRVAPDGTRWSVAVQSGSLLSAVTNLYRSGALVGAVPGAGLIWLSDTRLLVAEYESLPPGGLRFKALNIYDDQGDLISTVSSPAMSTNNDFLSVRVPLVPVSPSRAYYDNAIHDLATGTIIWSGSYPGPIPAATVIGNRVLSAVRNKIVVETF